MIPVGAILEKLKAEGILGAQIELAKIWEHWPEIADGEMSKHGQPYTVKEGCLIIRTDSTVWMHRFSYNKWKIIKRINRMANKELVSDIFLTLNPDDEPLGGK